MKSKKTVLNYKNQKASKRLFKYTKGSRKLKKLLEEELNGVSNRSEG